MVEKKLPHLTDPVCRLNRALYGHPDSGTFWEDHCDRHVKSVGFRPIGPEWPSCYWNDELKVFLAIYVDDFKMAGPQKNVKIGWNLLRKGLAIDKESSFDEKGTVYLGCRTVKSQIKLPDGTLATAISYGMKEFLQSCLKTYEDLARSQCKFKKVKTPFIADECGDAPVLNPAAVGLVTECPWCRHTFPPNQYDDIAALESVRKEHKQSLDSDRELSAINAEDSEVGALQSIACRIIMKVLWAARLARPDLLRPVSYLATFVTKWSPKQDRMLHRLMCYIYSSLDYKLTGWVGDCADDISPHLFADADFAGCASTQRSTSGSFLVARGPHTSWPIAFSSKRQGCVSHSTPEADIVATDYALRTHGIPSLDLWHLFCRSALHYACTRATKP